MLTLSQWPYVRPCIQTVKPTSTSTFGIVEGMGDYVSCQCVLYLCLQVRWQGLFSHCLHAATRRGVSLVQYPSFMRLQCQMNSITVVMALSWQPLRLLSLMPLLSQQCLTLRGKWEWDRAREKSNVRGEVESERRRVINDNGDLLWLTGWEYSKYFMWLDH